MNGKILKNVGSCASFYNNCYRTNEIEYNDLVENGDTVYFMENDDGEDEIFSMNVSDYPGFNMFRDYFNIVDVQEIFNSAQNSSFSQKEDKSYDVSITCDTSKDLGFIENIDFDISFEGSGMVAFNTTECKINMNISEDFFVTKINIEFSQTAETIEITYTCKYEMSFIGSDNTIAPQREWISRTQKPWNNFESALCIQQPWQSKAVIFLCRNEYERLQKVKIDNHI